MRIKTGIAGLDDYVEGFLNGSSTLVTGNPGTGKTLFCCQFLAKGLKEGDNCLYLSMDQEADDIMHDAAAIGIDFKEYMNYSSMSKPNFVIESHSPSDLAASL